MWEVMSAHGVQVQGPGGGLTAIVIVTVAAQMHFCHLISQ